ncbi:MAG: VCBS repeat-containing protein, partial [Candidatus Promineifilaceae bacterium]
DLDGDTDIDAFTASWFPNGNKVWLNDGSGQFSTNGQTLGSAASLGVDLADVDHDNDLDAVIGNNTPGPNQLWLNNGSGQFSAGQGIDSGTTTYEIALEDFDGDLDPDLFLANFGSNQLWSNGVPGTPDAYFAVERETNTDGNDVYYWGQSGNALVPVMLSQPAPQNMDVLVRIESPGNTVTETIPFSAGSSVQMLNLVNPQPDPDIDYTLSLYVPTLANQGGTPPTDSLTFVFVDGDQGPVDCILCYLDWLLRLLNFEPTFYQLHHFDLPAQETSPQWDYYTRLFDDYSPTLSALVAQNPSLAWSSQETLQEWTPAVESLSDGTGDSFVVTADMANDTNDLFNGLKDVADPNLAALIQHEQDLLDVESLAGLTMDEAWDEFVVRRPVEELYITIILKKE